MVENTTPPDSIRDLCEAYVEGLRQTFSDALFAVYLYGAVTFPESGPTGDLDVHVLLERKAGDYEWSSHRAYLGSDRLQCLRVDDVLELLGLPFGDHALDFDTFVLALDVGVSGYVLKEAASQELLLAVRAAAAGDVYLCPHVAKLAIGVLHAGGDFEPEMLTPRERDVLRLLTRGLVSKEIAAQLAVATRTVEYHRSNIMDKLGIRHIPGLVRYALRHGLATLDD